MKRAGLFVVGTDTDVGKTHVATAIVRSLAVSGRRVGVYKPVASGCATADDTAGDAWLLWDAAGKPLAPGDVFQGATSAPGGSHAEIGALRAAGELARGSTLYSTLEPCAHHGRTGPCAQRLHCGADVAARKIQPLPQLHGCRAMADAEKEKMHART